MVRIKTHYTKRLIIGAVAGLSCKIEMCPGDILKLFCEKAERRAAYRANLRRVQFVT